MHAMSNQTIKQVIVIRKDLRMRCGKEAVEIEWLRGGAAQPDRAARFVRLTDELALY
jgi:hypothetical protein